MFEIRNKFRESSFGRAFIVTFFFVTLAASLFWLDFFRGYSTEVTVLVISRSDAVGNSSSVADNMAALTKTLTFYNRLLVENDSLDDDFEGYTPDKRKESWNNTVFVTKQDASGVLFIRANGISPERSKQLAVQTAQTMFSVAGLYYNVKTDIDMRIVDGPLVSYMIQKPFLYIGTILLTSLSLTSIFFFLLQMVPEFIGKKKTERILSNPAFSGEHGVFDELDERYAYPEFNANDYATWIDPKKFIPEKPQTLSFERQIKHASAPANLPTASDDMNLPLADMSSLPFTFETVPEERETSEGESFEEITPVIEEISSTVSSQGEEKRGEPTVEDYKRRLNELLANVK